MAGWTKEQYDDAYRWRVERNFGGHPNTRREVKVHYHRWAMKPVLAAMWARLAPILNIADTEHVCLVGAGFGWGLDAFIAETSATSVGIDISDYIAAEQAGTEEIELRAQIALVGLDPDSGRGLELMGHIYDAQPRADIIVMQNDMSTVGLRQDIRTALGGEWPSVVLYEDIVDDSMTDQEITNARNAGNGFGGAQRLIWIYNGTAARSQADLQALAIGSEVISRDGQSHLVP